MERPSFPLCIVLLLCFGTLRRGSAQQSYRAGLPGKCGTTAPNTSAVVDVGYSCSQALPSCQTYAYYRTQESQSLSDVASLFATNTSALAMANSFSSSSSFLPNQPLFIPMSCACNSAKYSVMGIPYIIQSGDSFYKITLRLFKRLQHVVGSKRPILQ
ncbi:hypothetical protein L7F22_041077 [Adiantum nelumboides]|nr:hypothetical protein [Adiantum nelumboides]